MAELDSAPDTTAAATAAAEPMPDDETAVVPDAARTEAAQLAWSDADVPEPKVARPLPRSLRLLLGGVCAGAVAFGAFTLGQQYQKAHAPRPLPPPQSTTPAAPAGPTLTGTYRLDYHTDQVGYRGNAVPPKDPERPFTRWWAFRSSCSAAGCTAIGVRLDDENHAIARNPFITDTLNFVSGQWRDATPWTGHSEGTCPGTATLSWSFLPLVDGTLRGTEETTIVTNECGAKGNVTLTPITMARIGPVPDGIFTTQP